MKLYTREQMIEAFKYGQNPKGFDWIGDMIDSLKQIELPSDNQIEYACFEESIPIPSYVKGYIKGAKWVIEQIKQQNNGN